MKNKLKVRKEILIAVAFFALGVITTYIMINVSDSFLKQKLREHFIKKNGYIYCCGNTM